MQHLIERLVGEYERGRLNRRQLIQGLTAVATGVFAAPAPGSTFQGAAINHIALRVASIARSRDFYRELLGLPILQESEGACFLGIGKDFLTLFKNQTPGLDHYCIAIEDFKPDAVIAELKKQGLKPRRPAGTDRIYFPDPDGLEVQLSAVDHKP